MILPFTVAVLVLLLVYTIDVSLLFDVGVEKLNCGSPTFLIGSVIGEIVVVALATENILLTVPILKLFVES
jgi:hypothetical protein